MGVSRDLQYLTERMLKRHRETEFRSNRYRLPLSPSTIPYVTASPRYLLALSPTKTWSYRRRFPAIS
eukprot:976445-Rhodomonas_salina.3